MAEYVNWAPNEPTGSGKENCILKSYFAQRPGWHDAGCSWSSTTNNSGQIHALCEAAKEKQ